MAITFLKPLDHDLTLVVDGVGAAVVVVGGTGAAVGAGAVDELMIFFKLDTQIRWKGKGCTLASRLLNLVG